MNHDELVSKINEYTKITKERSLTEEEEIERKKLRDEYIKRIKNNLRDSLKGIKKK